LLLPRTFVAMILIGTLVLFPLLTVLGSSNITKFACEVSFEEVWLRISCEELKFTHAYEDTWQKNNKAHFKQKKKSIFFHKVRKKIVT
jgi:hypothetical protein